MCVLAAYLGDRPAAPVLLEMLEREEGLGGGYYTGVATVHEGRLHYAKLVGDVARLRAESDAMELPGHVGIAHSRTPSGGGREWGHPFIGNDETLAYVANGAMGLFDGRTDYTAAGDMLLECGYHFRSGIEEQIGPYPMLANGHCVHFSEIMALLIEENRRQGAELLQAAAQAFQQYPSEIVGLTIAAPAEDHFVAMRLNQPLVIGGSATEVCAATTSIAFPEGMDWRMTMPTNAAARVSLSGVEVLPFAQRTPAADMPAMDAVHSALLPALQQEPQSIGGMCKLTEPLWPEGKLPQKAMLVYETVAGLLAAGQVELVTERVPGMFEEGTVPRTKVRWIGAS